MDKLKHYPELKGDNSQDVNMEEEMVPRFKSDFEKVCKKWNKIKC
jgi:hypothetical protein